MPCAPGRRIESHTWCLRSAEPAVAQALLPAALALLPAQTGFARLA